MLKAWKLWNISLTLHWTGSNFTYFEWGGGGQILATPFKLSLEGIFGVKWIGDPKSIQKLIFTAFEKKNFQRVSQENQSLKKK